MNTRSPPANEKRRFRGRDRGAWETIKLIIPTFPYLQWEQECRGHAFVDGSILLTEFSTEVYLRMLSANFPAGTRTLVYLSSR